MNAFCPMHFEEQEYQFNCTADKIFVPSSQYDSRTTRKKTIYCKQREKKKRLICFSLYYVMQNLEQTESTGEQLIPLINLNKHLKEKDKDLSTVA